jgi:hypothetical protein
MKSLGISSPQQQLSIDMSGQEGSTGKSNSSNSGKHIKDVESENGGQQESQ